MRESNYKSVSNNKAAVIITTSLYDRRALDVTSDKPLVNSLNHLTYLVSSSAKVRETLSVDGGIERLVEILHECHNTTFSPCDNIFNSEKKLLASWKWTLTFQCLVLIGTRGTESIRQKVVKAGILPIIATVLDNYLSLHERTFIHANTRQQKQQFQQQFKDQIYQSQQPQETEQLHQFQHSQSSQQSQQLSDSQVSQGSQQASQISQASQVSQASQASQDFGSTQADQHYTQQQQQQQQQQYPQQPVVQPQQVRTQDSSHDINIPERNSNSFDFVLQNNFQLQNPLFREYTTEQNGYINRFREQTDSIPNPSSMPLFFNANNPNNLTSDDYDNLSIEQLFRLIKINHKTGTINNDIRRRYLIVNIIKKLREKREADILDDRFFNDDEYEMNNNLQFLSDLYIQDYNHNRELINSRIAPRNFTDTGVVIPRDDDIVWSLQLLAYISKYPYLKDVLQNTHLVIDMSIRDKQLKLYLEKQMKLKLKKSLAMTLRPTAVPKSRISKNNYSELFRSSATNSPQILKGLTSIDNFMLDEDKLELCKKSNTSTLTENAEVEDDSDEIEEEEEEEEDVCEEINDDNYDKIDDDLAELTNITINSTNYLSKLYDSIIDAESIATDLDRELTFYKINDRVNRFIDIETKKLVDTIIDKRLDQKKFLQEKWNYETYNHLDIDESNEDQDDSLVEYKKVNLFPMVEKFTFLSGTDMYYWSGVIMRNSCRRNESKGGIRQCGNLDCGKWEKFPREFSKCRKCKRTKYCSRECQIKAWHCHRNWCIPSNSSVTTSVATNQQSESQDPSQDVSQATDEDSGIRGDSW